MKKVIKLGLLSVALLSAVVVNASEKLRVRVASNSAKMLAISLTEVTSGEVMHIKDFKGEVLFSEKLEKAPTYTKVFSFSTLPHGLYFIESRDEEKVQVSPVVVNKDGVALVDSSVKTYLAPKISVSENIMNVSVRNYNKEEVTISVYDDFGTLINKTKGNTNTLVYGNYDISQLISQAKKLTVSVTTGDYNFIKEIDL